MNIEDYNPGPADLAHVEKDGDNWTLVLTKELRHSPDKVWNAITDPEHLKDWAPFDASDNLGSLGAKVTLTTVGAPAEYASETTVTRADAPHFLEYTWNNFNMRWQLEATPEGTRLHLWTNIDRRFIAMGAAGWHVCFGVLEAMLDGDPIGRTTGPDAMKFAGWQRLHKEYAAKFGVGEG